MKLAVTYEDGQVFYGDVSLGGIPSLVLFEFTEENITADNISLRPSAAYNADSSFKAITNTFKLGSVVQQLDYRTQSVIEDISNNVLKKNATSNYELSKFKNDLVYLTGVSDHADGSTAVSGHLVFTGHTSDGSVSVFDVDMNHGHYVQLGAITMLLSSIST